MQNITVGRYAHPEQVGFQGWIEPENRSWIVFVDLKGQPTLYTQRNSDGSIQVPAGELILETPRAATQPGVMPGVQGSPPVTVADIPRYRGDVDVDCEVCGGPCQGH